MRVAASPPPDEGTAMETQSVEFDNPSAGIRLSGTLTVPAGRGRHPAAVLVHGQGPLDRDMSFGRLRPFKALAEHLAANGIASLRYDKRGVGESGGDFASATRWDLAGDVVAGLDFLQRQETVLPDRVGLIGQSEGGLIAALVASRSDDVAFVVSLAGPAVAGRENLALSFTQFALASPTNDLEPGELRQRLERLLDLVGADSSRPEDRAAAMELAQSLAPHVVNERTSMVLGGPEVDAEQLLGLLSSPCMRETLGGEPDGYLADVTCPVLALFAELDRHVPARENGAAAKRQLQAAGNRDWAVETIAGCNHLFQRCETGYPDEYFTIDHDISPEVLSRVSGWILGARAG